MPIALLMRAVVGLASGDRDRGGAYMLNTCCSSPVPHNAIMVLEWTQLIRRFAVPKAEDRKTREGMAAGAAAQEESSEAL